MAALAPSTLTDRLRQRVDALALDRAPLRRAGLLTVLLIGLLALGRAFSPTSATAPDRQDVQSATEEVSVPRSSSAWTGGRVLAILFLVTGGGIAFLMHRRASGRSVASGSALRIIETYPLGPSQSLRLMACGEEVLLLSVSSEGTTLLRHWPREAFDTEESPSFASTLASLTAQPDSAQPSSASPTLPPSEVPSRQAPPLLSGEDETSNLSSEPASQPRHSNQQRADETTGLPGSTSEASDQHGTDSRPHNDAADEQVTTAPEPIWVRTRGSLFPARAPRQFDVHHG